MKRVLREPLLHFLLLGVALFIGYRVVSASNGERPGSIVITQGQLASMMDGFTSTRQRQPTAEEWDGLIRARVREELYYREALALGLDKDDVIIRRRLQQKMEFISEGAVPDVPPTDAQLATYLKAHPDKFQVEETFTFHQAYLDPERRGANLAHDAAQLLVKLNGGGAVDLNTTGDPIMLDHDFKAIAASDVAARFGGTFAAKLNELGPGRWQGPIESAFGAHLVLVDQRAEPRLPELAEVREAVARAWDEDRIAEANETFYQELLKHYIVTIEQPEARSTAVPHQ